MKFDFGNIRILRNLKGMTLPELAKLAGVSKGYLSQLESGKQDNPTVQTLSKIADVFDVRVGSLISDRERSCVRVDYLKWLSWRAEKCFSDHNEEPSESNVQEALLDAFHFANDRARCDCAEFEDIALTALGLIRAALEQMPDKQGGTRCKIDIAQQVLSNYLARLNYRKLEEAK